MLLTYHILHTYLSSHRLSSTLIDLIHPLLSHNEAFYEFYLDATSRTFTSLDRSG